jgi:hypothetical protein
MMDIPREADAFTDGWTFDRGRSAGSCEDGLHVGESIPGPGAQAIVELRGAQSGMNWLRQSLFRSKAYRLGFSLMPR